MSTRAEEIVRAAARGAVTDPDTRMRVRALPGGSLRVACLHGEAEQVIAEFRDGARAEALVERILQEADIQRAEILDAAASGDIPGEVGRFADLHDHIDANMLGSGGAIDEVVAEYGVGVGAPDTDEAWCGFLNCSHNAVDAWLRRGGLREALAERAGGPRP